MVDLVLLRELIRNDLVRGHTDDIDLVFAQTGFGFLFGSILVIDSLPYRPVAIALTFSLLGVNTIHARSRSGTDVRKFPERYVARLARLLRLDSVRTIVGSTLK